jgi:hypothetical protein
MIPQQETLAGRWAKLETTLAERFGKKPDLNAVLFLIGIQEFGQLRATFTKEEKQDLMHVAVCHLLSNSGYYALDRIDEDGWPHYRQLTALPSLHMMEQENFIKDHVLLYFEQIDHSSHAH